MMFNPDQAMSLFSAVWPDTGFGEIRMLKPTGGALKPMFLPLPLNNKVASVGLSHIERENNAGNNAYFGVNPRIQKRGCNADVPSYYALIADLDDLEGSWAAVQRVSRAGAEPSACVRTTRGAHLYWFLKQPEAATDLTRQRSLQLQIALGSDKVHDPARILRVPGTMCWKTTTPHEIYTAWINHSRRYSTAELAEVTNCAFPELRFDEQARHVVVPSALLLSFGPPREMSAGQIAKFSAFYAKGGRSEMCLSFIQTALCLGWTDEMIRGRLLALSIGQHYFDRGHNGPASFQYDLDRAKENIARHRGRLTRARITQSSLLITARPGGYRYRVLFTLEYGADNGEVIRLRESVTIPDINDPEMTQNRWLRWQLFAGAVGLEGDKVDRVGYGLLNNRELMVEIKSFEERTKAVWFSAI